MTEHESYLTPEDREGLGQCNYKRFLAYQCLGIRPQDVEIVPLFREQLRGLARCITRDRTRGKGTQPVSPVGPFCCLQASPDPDARKVLAAYQSVPASYRRLLPPEAFCLAAAVPPTRVLEIIAVAVVKEGARITAVRAAMRQARVLDKTFERALKDDGWRDRLMIHKATGALPTWGWKGGDNGFGLHEAEDEGSPGDEP